MKKDIETKQAIIDEVREAVNKDLKIPVSELFRIQDWVKEHYPEYWGYVGVAVTDSTNHLGFVDANTKTLVDGPRTLLHFREWLYMLGKGPNMKSKISVKDVKSIERRLCTFGNKFVDRHEVVDAIGDKLPQLAHAVMYGTPSIAHTGPHGRPPKAVSVLDVIALLLRYTDKSVLDQREVQSIPSMDLRKIYPGQAPESVFYVLVQEPNGKVSWMRAPVFTRA
jgi:hypothetical protein